jgi:uncharacterized Zn-finger protein
MQASEIILAEERVVACDGGDAPLGHPRVFLNMGDKTEIDCPYCGRCYALKSAAKATAAAH